MITLKSAKKLDKLGIINTKRCKILTWELEIPIEELLQKLPYFIDIHKGINKYTVEYCCEHLTVHKNLTEALSRLIIKLHEEKLI